MVLVVFLFLFFPPSDTTLLESGKATTLRKQTYTPQEIKIVSYNIRWRSGDDLKKIIELLENDPEIGGAVMGVDRGVYPQARSFLGGVQLTF